MGFAKWWLLVNLPLHVRAHVDYQTDKEIADLHRVVGKKRLGGERQPNHNSKPTQTLRAVQLDDHGEREIAAVRWGFVPSGSKEMSKQAWINAKAETMAQPRPMWKAAVKARRCLVPVNGFHERLKPERGPKQPYFIFLPDGPMTFAGIWESWHHDGEDPVESVALATVEPSKEFSRFHDRQVVVLHTRKEQDA